MLNAYFFFCSQASDLGGKPSTLIGTTAIIVVVAQAVAKRTWNDRFLLRRGILEMWQTAGC